MKARNPCKGRGLSTIDLLVRNSLYQQLFILKFLVIFFTKRATLMRSLPLQLAFPGERKKQSYITTVMVSYFHSERHCVEIPHAKCHAVNFIMKCQYNTQHDIRHNHIGCDQFQHGTDWHHADYYHSDCHYADYCHPECNHADFHYAERHYEECHCAKCPLLSAFYTYRYYSERRHAECHNAKCHYTKCRGANNIHDQNFRMPPQWDERDPP
jgi:hypothetical protein